MSRRDPGLRLALPAVAALLALLGCTDDADEPGPPAEEPQAATTDEVELVADGRLTVCLDAPLPPFVTLDGDGDHGGFEVEVLRELADRLGLELEVEPARVERIQSGDVLAAGRCDLGGSGLQVTERRAEQVDFTRPYLQTRQALLVPADRLEATEEALGIEASDALGDLGVLERAEGLRLGVRADSDGQALAEEQLDDVEVVAYDEPGDLLPALLAGDVHVVLRDLTAGAEQAAAVDGVVVAATLPTGQPFAFALRSGRTDGLGAAVDEALEEMAADSTRDAIFEDAFDVEP